MLSISRQPPSVALLDAYFCIIFDICECDCAKLDLPWGSRHWISPGWKRCNDLSLQSRQEPECAVNRPETPRVTLTDGQMQNGQHKKQQRICVTTVLQTLLIMNNVSPGVYNCFTCKQAMHARCKRST